MVCRQWRQTHTCSGRRGRRRYPTQLLAGSTDHSISAGTPSYHEPSDIVRAHLLGTMARTWWSSSGEGRKKRRNGRLHSREALLLLLFDRSPTAPGASIAGENPRLATPRHGPRSTLGPIQHMCARGSHSQWWQRIFPIMTCHCAPQRRCSASC